MSSVLADQLLAARRRAFVGRQTELALFEKLLTPGGDGAIAYVHGPGGVGKSTLLRQVAWLAGQVGRRVLWLDGRDLAPDGTDVAAAVAADPEPGPVVVVVDTAERLGPADRWLREDLLTALPGDAVVVIAGREPPPLAWRVDQGWRELVRVSAMIVRLRSTPCATLSRASDLDRRWTRRGGRAGHQPAADRRGAGSPPGPHRGHR